MHGSSETIRSSGIIPGISVILRPSAGGAQLFARHDRLRNDQQDLLHVCNRTDVVKEVLIRRSAWMSWAVEMFTLKKRCGTLRVRDRSMPLSRSANCWLICR